MLGDFLSTVSQCTASFGSEFKCRLGLLHYVLRLWLTRPQDVVDMCGEYQFDISIYGVAIECLDDTVLFHPRIS